MQTVIEKFFTSPAFGVVGVSTNRDKYGNRVLRCYLEHNKTVYPIHPSEKIIEGVACLQHISDLPAEVKSLSMVTPPPVTEKLVDQAIAKGIQNIWMQPGVDSPLAVEKCKKNNINVIYGGTCILVVLGCHHHIG